MVLKAKCNRYLFSLFKVPNAIVCFSLFCIYVGSFLKWMNLKIYAFKMEHWKIIVRSQSMELLRLLACSLVFISFPGRLLEFTTDYDFRLGHEVWFGNKMGAKVNDGQIISALTKYSFLCSLNWECPCRCHLVRIRMKFHWEQSPQMVHNRYVL